MTIQVSEGEQEGVVLLRLDGRLDAASTPLLERKLSSVLEAGQKELVLNFDKVHYLSSAGLRLLLVISKKLRIHQGRMVLAGVSQDVMEVIRMAGFDQVLEVSGTEGEAVARLSA